MIETVKLHDVICAIIIRREYERNGIEFFTVPTDTLQLGYMKRPAGYKIAPHIHNPVMRSVELTNEVLFIKSGKVKVNFYDTNGMPFTSALLISGDVILLSMHGHGFEMLEESEIVEVKQGPYAGEADKIRFLH